MKKLVSVLFLFLSFAGFVSAQNLSIGVTGAAAIPVSSDFKDAFKTGFGGLATFGYSLDQSLMLTVSTGYINFDAKDMPETIFGTPTGNHSLIPLHAGIKYIFSPGQIRPYGVLDLGVDFTKTKVSLGGYDNTENSSDFGYGFGLGAFIDLSQNLMADVNLKYNGVSEDTTVGYISIMAGVVFGL